MKLLTELRLAWGRARAWAGVPAQDDWRLYARVASPARMVLTLVNFADGQHAQHDVALADETDRFFRRHGIHPQAVRMAGVMRKMGD